MLGQLVVTTIENINTQTNKLIDDELRGYIVKSETIQESVYEEMQDNEGNPAPAQLVGTKLRSICTVAWVGKAPYHPAIAPFYADQLVLIGQENSIAEITEQVNAIDDRLSDIEEDLEDLMNDDDDGDEPEARNVNGPANA